MTVTTDWAVSVPIGYRVGDWQVVRAIATGAWGSVYAAKRFRPGPADTLTTGTAALKFLATGTTTPRMTARVSDLIEREVAGHTALRHERLVRTLGLLTVDDPAVPELDGAAVLVLELAECSLADVLAERTVQHIGSATRWAGEIAEGLAAIHAAGWVHGDVKPSNILIRADGSCCLADFGMAGMLEGTHAYVPPMSTPLFAAPERGLALAGVRGQRLHPSADIWAFGIVAAMTLGRTTPFSEDGGWAFDQALTQYADGRAALTLDDRIAPAWRALITRCLAVRPQDRPTAAELVELIVAAGNEPIETGADPPADTAEPTSPPAPALPVPTRTPSNGQHSWVAPGLRRKLMAGALLSALVSIGLVLAGSRLDLWNSSQSPTSRPAVSTPPPALAAQVPANRCLSKASAQRDAFSGQVWYRVAYCRNRPWTPLYASPADTDQVGWLVTTTSWFVCYRQGDPDRPEDIWYYTQGDKAVAPYTARHAWGYLRADRVLAEQAPFPGIPPCSGGV